LSKQGLALLMATLQPFRFENARSSHAETQKCSAVALIVAFSRIATIALSNSVMVIGFTSDS